MLALKNWLQIIGTRDWTTNILIRWAMVSDRNGRYSKVRRAMLCIEHGVPLIANISVTNFRCQFTLTSLKSNKNKTGRHIWIDFNTLENDEEDFDSLQCFIDECFKRIVMGKPNSADSLQQTRSIYKKKWPRRFTRASFTTDQWHGEHFADDRQNYYFLIYGLLNRGGPVQEKCQFFWGQYGHNGFLKGLLVQCVILAREVSLSIVWLDLITNFCRNR